MASEFFGQALTVYRERVAAELGCDTSAFDSHALTIVDRPAHLPAHTLLFATTFGTGSVVSVRPEYRSFVAGLPLKKHFHAFNTHDLPLPVALEARARGLEVVIRGPGLGFLPGVEPDPPEFPAGLRLERWEPDRAAPWAPTFHNALWDEGEEEIDRFRYALVLVDELGSPQAMAGAWHEADGLVEIGVDVAHDARGRGLGPLIVRAMARSIFDAGGVPTYYCASGNVRSHRTALASGFIPVISGVTIREKPPKPGG